LYQKKKAKTIIIYYFRSLMSKIGEDVCSNIVRFDWQLNQHVSYEDDGVHQTKLFRTKESRIF